MGYLELVFHSGHQAAGVCSARTSCLKHLQVVPLPVVVGCWFLPDVFFQCCCHLFILCRLGRTSEHSPEWLFRKLLIKYDFIDKIHIQFAPVQKWHNNGAVELLKAVSSACRVCICSL